MDAGFIYWFIAGVVGIFLCDRDALDEMRASPPLVFLYLMFAGAGGALLLLIGVIVAIKRAAKP